MDVAARHVLTTRPTTFATLSNMADTSNNTADLPLRQDPLPSAPAPPSTVLAGISAGEPKSSEEAFALS